MSIYYVDPTKTGGANNGTTRADAWLSIQTAFDTATAGDFVYCIGTQTLTAVLDIDTQIGTIGSYIVFKGINTDGSVDPEDDVDGTQFIIDGNSYGGDNIDVTGTRSFYQFVNIASINSTAYGMDINGAMVSCIFRGCSFDNNLVGMDMGTTTNGTSFMQCSFDSNGSNGISNIEASLFDCCQAIGNTTSGFLRQGFGGLSCWHNTIAHNNGSYGISMEGDYVINCVLDGNVSGIAAGATYGHVIYSRLTNNSAYGITSLLSTDGLNEARNAFYNNTSGEFGIGNFQNMGVDISMAGDGYVNRAGDNFSLTDSAEGRREAVLIGAWSA